MRYILDVSGRDLKLLRASIVNFQRSLEMSDQAEFDGLIDELDDCFLTITRQKKEQLKNKVMKKWGKKRWNVFTENLIEGKDISSRN